VLRLAKRLRLSLDVVSANVRAVFRNFGPVFVSRGVVQLSAYVDTLLSSKLPTGSMTALLNAQSLALLPISLFGMAVSAAELPAMSAATGNPEEVAEYLRRRLNAGLRQIAFLIVPSAMGFLALGDVMVAALFQGGAFTRADTLYVWGIVAGSTVGLLASTLGRLYSSTYYALRDTRTPLRFAIVRVVLTTVLGYLCALQLPGWIGVEPRWGVAGLTASAGVAGWVEFYLLRRALNRRIGQTGLSAGFMAKLWVAAAVAAAAGWGVKMLVPEQKEILRAALVLAPYGLLYFAITAGMGLQEAMAVTGRLWRRLRL
jgi:putative peptidoglycan lipid II flippase